MSFDYGEYLFQNFWLPISILSFFLLGGCFALLFMKPVKTAYEKENEPEETLAQKLLGGLLAVITFGFLLYINLRTLFGLGVDLYRDRNEQAIEHRGVIEEIDPSKEPDLHKYHTAEGTSFGVMMTVGGERFHAMSAADFEVGQTVQVLYLPNSHCVLEIHEID